jgi:ribosomal protein S18 acetylase RimI-like enzyme
VRSHGIRELTADDAGPYAALRLRMLREYTEAFTSSYEDDAGKPLAWVQKRIAHDPEAPHNFVLGAFADDTALIGSVGLSVEGRIKQRHKALLFGMFVAPGEMFRGVGRSLLDHCIGRAAAIPGLEQITLTVTASNARALRFYEAAGFRTFGVEERALKIAGAYHPKAHMILYLAPPAGQPR